LKFEITATDGAARRGRISTVHGDLESPGFFAVATRSALKGLDPEAADRAGVRALIVNAYHQHLQPGAEAVARQGGLHRAMGWDGVLATDSGGFQIFSFRHGLVAEEIKGNRRRPQNPDEDHLAAVQVDEDGADFRSYLDGARHRFTPESNMALQRDLGADLLMCFDECTPFHVPRDYTEAAMERNLRWARRCWNEFERLGMADRQSLFAINHGGVYEDLRSLNALAIADLPVAGFAIGDCLGQTKQDWYRIVDLVCPLLPPERPRHLLGVGEPDDLIEGALRGIDTFDCAMPTRIARHGAALHASEPRGRLDCTAPSRATEDGPLEEGCDCHTCARFSRSYLWHLHRAHEMLAVTLTAEHNLRHTTRLLEQVRAAITAGRLTELRDQTLAARKRGHSAFE